MKATNPDPDQLLPLTPATFHILMALANGKRHGYGIMKEVAILTDGRGQMGPGTLYGAIKRMLTAGLIEECDERPDPDLDDQRRRYYKLTGFGRRVAVAEAQRLSNLIQLAQAKHLIGGTALVPSEGGV